MSSRVFLIALISACAIISALAKQDEVSKSSKYYQKINDHLVKHIKSDEPEPNMAEANRWLNSGFLKLRSKDLSQALGKFVLLPDVTANFSMCSDRGMEILEANDRGLFSQARLEQANYTPQRVDKLIDHFHDEYLFTCGDYIRYDKTIPQSAFGWKMLAYEKINKFLADLKISGAEIPSALQKLSEWYDELKKENEAGALTAAVEQLLAIESAVEGDKCSYKSYQILMRNEVATKPRGDISDIQIVRDLVSAHRMHHRKICRKIYPQKFQETIKNLDVDTLRSVVILTSEFFFQDEKHKPLADSISHSKYLTVNPDFTSPEIIALMEKSIAAFESFQGSMRYERKYYTTNQHLYRTLKLIMSRSHPEYKYLFGPIKEEDGSAAERKVLELHEKYLLNPCKKYLIAVDEEIMEPRRYDHILGTDYYDVRLDELMPNLGFYLGTSATRLCKTLLELADTHREQLLRLATNPQARAGLDTDI